MPAEPTEEPEQAAEEAFGGALPSVTFVANPALAQNFIATQAPLTETNA